MAIKEKLSNANTKNTVKYYRKNLHFSLKLLIITILDALKILPNLILLLNIFILHSE